jgi:hypothetical protein
MAGPKNGAGLKRLTGPKKGARPAKAATGAVARRRVGVIRVVVILVFVIIAGRLVIVQVFSGGRYSSIGVAEVTSTTATGPFSPPPSPGRRSSVTPSSSIIRERRRPLWLPCWACRRAP